MNDPTVVFVPADGRPADATSAALERDGLEVIATRGPIEATRHLDASEVDCVAIEPPLADPGAEWFLKRVRRSSGSLPVVLVGGRGDDVPPDLAVRTDAYVDGSPSEIADAIRTSVADRRAEGSVAARRDLERCVLEIGTTLPEAADPVDVERTVYDRLAETSRYRSIWLGTPAPGQGGVRVRFPAAVRGSDEGGDSGPVVPAPRYVKRAIEDGSVALAETDAAGSISGKQEGDAPDLAESGETAGVAVPLVHGHDTYGVVVLETAGPVDDAERSLLEDLGSLAGRELHRLDTGAEDGSADERRRFAEGLAHELRNALGIASTHLELGREGDEEALDEARAALDELDRIVDEMLSLAAGLDEQTAREFREDVTEAWEGVRTEGAELVVEDSEPIVADHDQTVRLLENLLRNAVVHGSPGERDAADDTADRRSGSEAADAAVTVRAGVFESGFYVEDDGPGIPESERDRIFEWGYSNDGGPGVGLGVVRTIAAEHGWSVAATDGQTGGSRIEVTGVRRPSD